MRRIGRGYLRRRDQVQIFAIPGCTGREIIAALDRDAAVDDQGLGYGSGIGRLGRQVVGAEREQAPDDRVPDAEGRVLRADAAGLRGGRVAGGDRGRQAAREIGGLGRVGAAGRRRAGISGDPCRGLRRVAVAAVPPSLPAAGTMARTKVG